MDSEPTTWAAALAERESRQFLEEDAGPSALSHLDMDDDPLGIGSAQPAASAAHSRGSSRLAGRARSGSRTASFNPTIITTSEAFLPEKYLTHHYSEASFADLRKGSDHLAEKMTRRNEQIKLLVKDNFDRFVSCKDTIDIIQAQLRAKQSKDGTQLPITRKLYQSFDHVRSRTETVFSSLLERKQEIDKTRNVLGVLRRFTFLYHLPTTIKASIDRGDYEKVLRDYRKAQSFDSLRTVAIFNTILQEVDEIAVSFQSQLLDRLNNPLAPIQEQERIIGVLRDLHPAQQGQQRSLDPAWHYLECQHRWILALLDACVAEHQDKVAALASRFDEHSNTESRWSQSQDLAAAAPASPAATPEPQTPTRLARQGSVAAGPSAAARQALMDQGLHSGRLINRLTAVLVRILPDFWLLTQAILGNKFSRSLGSAVDQHDPIEQRTRVHAMLLDIVSSYTSKIRGAFMHDDQSTTTATAHTMHRGVKEIIGCCESLRSVSLGDVPGSFLGDELTVLAEEVRAYYVEAVCSHMIKDARTTSQALQLHAQVTSALGLLTGLFGPDHLLARHVCESTVEALQVFLDTLHSLAFDSEADGLPLAVMGACEQVRSVVLPEVLEDLAAKFGAHGSDKRDGILDLLDRLEAALASRFIQQEALELSQMVHSGLVLSGTDWTAVGEPKAIRRYVEEILLELVSVHHQVFSAVPRLCDRIFERLLEHIAQAFALSIRALDAMNPNGARQIALELDCLIAVLGEYAGKRSRHLVDACRSHLARRAVLLPRDLALGAPGDDILERFRTRTRKQLACFAVGAGLLGNG